MRATEKQLSKINSFSLEKQLSFEDVEVFKVYLIDEKPTTYNSIVKSDLRSAFAKNIMEGRVGLLLYHDDRSLNVGRFFDYELEHDKLYGWVYIVKGAKNEVIDSDTLIENIKNGTYRSVSIGFTTSIEDYVCSICGEKYYTGECVHFAGVEYDGETCYVMVGNDKGEGRLLEVSIVPAGAVEDAEFVKVNVSDEVFPQQFSTTCNKGGFCYNKGDDKFLMKKLVKNFNGDLTMEEKGGQKMGDKNYVELYAETVAELKVMQKEHEQLKAEFEELKKKADEYKASYDSAIEESATVEKRLSALESALEEVDKLFEEYGVKAEGEKFDKESFAKLSYSEKVEKFKAYVEKFVETFQPGKVTEDEKDVKFGVEINAFRK